MFCDESDDRYRLTIMVRSLSEGFDDDAWVSRIAKPMIEELGRELVWPVSLATLSGTNLVVREATDHSSPSPWIDTRPAIASRSCRAPADGCT